MKVYSWPTLLETVLVGGIIAIGYIWGKLDNLGWGVLMCIFGGRGLYAALTKDGYEESKTRSAKSKKVYRKLFGGWETVMQWVPALLFLLAWACAKLIPMQKWLVALFMASGLIYIVWLFVVVRRQMNLPDEPEQPKS